MEYFDKDTQFGYDTPEEMKRVWDVQLDLLCKFREVCERHGLHFWLEGGTLLGAVRHKGFIPWDDDIDVAMMRDDYDRLNRIAKEEFTGLYFWQTTYSDIDFYCGHAILRRTDTTCLDRHTINKSHCLGIGIDIFVMDGVPSNAVTYFFHRSTAKILNGIIRFCIERHAKLVSYKKLFGLYESLFRMHDVNKSKHIGLISWRYRHKEIHPRSYYDETSYLDFIGCQYPVPHKYTEWLSDYYGSDYMTPKQSPTFHGTKYLDATTPYLVSIQRIREHPETVNWS